MGRNAAKYDNEVRLGDMPESPSEFSGSIDSGSDEATSFGMRRNFMGKVTKEAVRLSNSATGDETPKEQKAEPKEKNQVEKTSETSSSGVFSRKSTSLNTTTMRLGNIDSNSSAVVSETVEFRAERRGFLEKIVAGMATLLGISVLYPVSQYVIPPAKKKAVETQKAVGKVSEVPQDSGKIYRFAGDRVLVLNYKGELKAMSAVCTHLGCLVQWRTDEQLVYCACHGARYTKEGEIISGPQPAPLKPYGVHVEGDDIVLSVI
ncbi:Rieske (2Fe-2S) domain protein [Chloroherpeton thalassium ATCC 35110]|uniref:Rieske (2Fe-2S) domain protein n=2 Tax=Chloroherpeton thalassium TaxID=100716 RepID=B3QUN9_CHLT3|nr:Rieske (2Fe-2S) domain protein [Chloroherpeton thalassium ATCC 35110]